MLIANMPDDACIHLAATVSSCVIAAVSVISKSVYALYSKRNGGVRVHNALLECNPVRKETERTAALLASTMVDSDMRQDAIYKNVLTFISDALLTTWKDLLSEKRTITDDMCAVRLTYNMQNCLKMICDLDSTNSEFCSWADVTIADCSEAFARCMEIDRKSYRMRLETRMDACAVCLSSKIRVYIRHVHMRSLMKKPCSNDIHAAVRMCDIMIFLGLATPAFERLPYPLTHTNAEPHVKRCAAAAIENASALSFVSGDVVTTVIPSHSECIILHSSHAISKLYIDLCRMTSFPSAFITAEYSRIDGFFVSPQSRLMTDLTHMQHGTDLSSVLHMGSSTSVLRRSLTPVHVLTYDITKTRMLLMISEASV